jgi:hypothetical protein
MWSLSAVLLLAVPGAAGPSGPSPAPDLAPPVRLLAAGKPINVDIGHAAPCVADLRGTGKPQLIVGQFGDGKLRVYANKGSAGKPRFEGFEWFAAGGSVGKIEAG